MKNLMKQTAGVVAVTFALFVGLDYAMTTPDVMVSYSTNNCVSVVNYDGMFFSGGDFSCENLPSKYNQVWVK